MGRLGAIAAAVGLVAAGLVGVAAPANAGIRDGDDLKGSPIEDLQLCDAFKSDTYFETVEP